MFKIVAMGLDLAWSVRNPSGGAVIGDGALIDVRADLTDDASILAWVGRWCAQGASVVLAVDAPLCVPNEVGRRECERRLGEAWRQFDAGPYPSNRSRFAALGIRGEDLVRELGALHGFVERVELDAARPGRYVCEVFPHPAHVSLFQRARILTYKKKGKRTYAACWAGLTEYAHLLRSLAQREPPLRDPKGLIPTEFDGLRGKAFKAREDALDAITCAYVAAYLWRWGRAGTWIYGTVQDGHILVPRYPPALEDSSSASVRSA